MEKLYVGKLDVKGKERLRSFQKRKLKDMIREDCYVVLQEGEKEIKKGRVYTTRSLYDFLTQNKSKENPIRIIGNWEIARDLKKYLLEKKLKREEYPEIREIEEGLSLELKRGKISF